MDEDRCRGLGDGLVRRPEAEFHKGLLGFFPVEERDEGIGQIPHMVPVGVSIDHRDRVFDHDYFGRKDQLVRTALFDPRQ